MKSFLIHSILCLYICMLCNTQLQGMNNKIVASQEPVKLNRIWTQASLGEIKEKEIKRFLEANVLAISYADNSDEKKIKLLHNLFTQAFYVGAIKDPFEKQFCGIRLNCDNDEPRNVFTSSQINFASIMEFATMAGNNFLLEQAVKTGILLKNTLHFNEKMSHALVSAIDHCAISEGEERCEIFKKYDISFNILLKNGETLLHRYMCIPQTAVWFLENTDIDGNKQDNKGNTAAHCLASTVVHDRALLVRIFNAFIKKYIDPWITNKKGQTAKDIAIDNYYRYDSMCYASNANLFNKLEEMFRPKSLCSSPREKFVLKDDGDTIELTYQ